MNIISIVYNAYTQNRKQFLGSSVDFANLGPVVFSEEVKLMHTILIIAIISLPYIAFVYLIFIKTYLKKKS
ncbi:hypothetical protein [Psychrobacillus lasiicapitis]|uniref:hypothetical protein n=1 Tax=Psychrobacillus lasiicapitis TaxID=1636719 RepID=UPI001B881C01|nr:hypothetical protein [Psychrobacillus lasiicapitis]